MAARADTIALIAYLSTFAVGFVVRPFGALFFGRIGDLIGRRLTPALCRGHYHSYQVRQAPFLKLHACPDFQRSFACWMFFVV
jgi:MFS family permease